ncbi:hypothetical protein CCR75_005879 [Bremia lactucae]|uniref:Apple domain-containing protein n=1 Tax=Bremia lactucae TaxID=4779 RepID=A0A976FMK6_BRELC|nr:hypothetical protein CCR75_005879 [Bremia lactucae]
MMLSINFILLGFGTLAVVSKATEPCSTLTFDIEYIGGDVGSVLSASITGCCNLCSQHESCKAFTWNGVNGGTCWFKSSSEHSKASIGSISAAIQQLTSELWHMSPIKVIQARIQGDAPVWDPSVNRFLSRYGSSTDDKYMNNLDTVNMASVDGALMYVQAEGINIKEHSITCERKNHMQFIVFYEMQILQPTASIQHYETHTPLEYGKFVAMDGAKCTNAGSEVLDSCKVYYGLDNTTQIGPNVGCDEQDSDPRAPYPGNYWCSYPNSCAIMDRASKSSECRAQYRGGLCPMGIEPDGITCTFSYQILGYLNLDDLVGITKLGFSNYYNFCQNGGIEFQATHSENGFDVEECLEFWREPGNPEANRNRTSQMIAMYNDRIRNGQSLHMRPLPSVQSLTDSNPECYKNSPTCASAPFGCKRSMLSQICSVCLTVEPECKTPPAYFAFPNLSQI